MDPETFQLVHALPRVYGEMFLQICREYASLPNPRTLTLHEIRFFYEPLRAELKRHASSTPQPSIPNTPRKK